MSNELPQLTKDEEEILSELFTPEQRERYIQSKEYWSKAMQPMIDEARESEYLTAEDYQIRINC